MIVLGTNICTPALVYIVINILLILYILISLTRIMGFDVWIWALINLLFILFWTFVLNAICAYGYTYVSWILVVFPIVVILFYTLM
jgi:hypothetical protein